MKAIISSMVVVVASLVWTANLAGGCQEVGAKSRQDSYGMQINVPEILALVLKDVLTNSELEFARRSYGDPASKILALSTDSKIPWVAGLPAHIAECNLIFLSSDHKSRKRILGIELRHLDLLHRTGHPKTSVFDHQIQVAIISIGDDGPRGAYLVDYSIRQDGDNFTVIFEKAGRP